MIIDAHHHLWRYDPAEYGWIDEPALQRDFLPAELEREIRLAKVDRVVTVQARQSLEETRWLLDLAERHSFIAGVVGWVPLASPTVHEDLARCAAHPRLRAVRHVLQDEPDPGYMLRPDFDRGVAALGAFGLSYELLIRESQLPAAIELVDRHPDLVFVLDHLAKPRIREFVLEPWRTHVRELARRPRVFCKLSGMVTEADHRAWTTAQLRPYAETVLEAFGPERIMAGSDWPVGLAACGYQRWWEVVGELIAQLGQSEREQVLGGTAQRAYGVA